MGTKNTVELLEKAIELLEMWIDVDIPDTVWAEPGEYYTLPIDTQAFLQEIKGKR